MSSAPAAAGASSAYLAKPISEHAYVAVHVAFFQDARLLCLGIHQPGFESPWFGARSWNSRWQCR